MGWVGVGVGLGPGKGEGVGRSLSITPQSLSPYLPDVEQMVISQPWPQALSAHLVCGGQPSTEREWRGGCPPIKSVVTPRVGLEVQVGVAPVFRYCSATLCAGVQQRWQDSPRCHRTCQESNDCQ